MRGKTHYHMFADMKTMTINVKQDYQKSSVFWKTRPKLIKKKIPKLIKENKV